MVEAPVTKPIARCRQCGRPFTANANGRPRAYCSGKCRQAAYRERKSALRNWQVYGSVRGGWKHLEDVEPDGRPPFTAARRAAREFKTAFPRSRIVVVDPDQDEDGKRARYELYALQDKSNAVLASFLIRLGADGRPIFSEDEIATALLALVLIEDDVTEPREGST